VANITCTWELGGGIGHAANLSALGIMLQERGHNVSYILNNPAALSHFVSTDDVNVAKAPRWMKNIAGLPSPAASYSEILMKRGYLDPKILMGLCQRWQKLLLKYKTDLLITDYSPTAILTAYILNIKCVSFCNGFATPPRISPLPAFRKEFQNDMQRFIQGEKKILVSVNTVLKEFNRPVLNELADMFRYVSESFITTFPEMDPYQHRSRASYVGHVNRQGKNNEDLNIYTKNNNKKIFIYLKKEYKQLQQVLSHLQHLNADSIIYINNLPNDIRKQFESEKMFFSKKALDISKILNECDVIVCHANHGIVLESLLAGTPVLMLPMVYEQHLTAMQVESLQAGKIINPADENAQLQMQQVLDDESFISNAKDFAKRYNGIDTKETLKKIIDRCEALLP
jgi:UDP:flavonoid glycosyltransferase YjiC (YdhE family)